MCSNCASRSGWFEPSCDLRLNWREKPSLTSSLHTVSALIGCPIAVGVSASLSMLLETHIRGRMGSPRVAGSTSRSSSGRRPGSTSATARRPPPARRTLSFVSGSASRSSSPRLIVRAGKTCNPRHDGQTSPPSSSHLSRREQPPPAFVEPEPSCLPAISNGVFVDHPPRVRLSAKIRNPSKPSHTDARQQNAIQLLFGGSLEWPSDAAEEPGERPSCRRLAPGASEPRLRTEVCPFADPVEVEGAHGRDGRPRRYRHAHDFGNGKRDARRRARCAVHTLGFGPFLPDSLARARVTK